ncbi:gTP cyclohydrolase 1 [Firmicutes bacterium CAG:882]|nr:gTP cyclohydrolase 1 [Firmicutes bacterium CAG:882]
MDKEKIKEGVRLILEGVGEDTTREGLIETPDRIARMYEEIFSGIDKDRIDVKDPDSIVRDILSKTFEAKEGQFILEKDITFYSMCEHHLLPFYGKAHIAYISSGRVAGLSKLARTVEEYAKRPQLQERLTAQIADAIMEYLHAEGVMVVIEAEHMCMTMRGVKKPGSSTMTYICRGAFEENDAAMLRVLELLK